MTQNNDDYSLLKALRKLYFKFSEFDLNKRLGFYRKKIGANETRDISAPLGRHIEVLAAGRKDQTDAVTKGDAHIESSSLEESNIEQMDTSSVVENETIEKTTWVRKIINKVASPYASTAGKKESDQYMSERLKASTISHIHLALNQARHGEVDNAKLHAEIANQALKESAHYMSEAEYHALNKEVEDTFKELHEIQH